MKMSRLGLRHSTSLFILFAAYGNIHCGLKMGEVVRSICKPTEIFTSYTIKDGCKLATCVPLGLSESCIYLGSNSGPGFRCPKHSLVIGPVETPKGRYSQCCRKKGLCYKHCFLSKTIYSYGRGFQVKPPQGYYITGRRDLGPYADPNDSTLFRIELCSLQPCPRSLGTFKRHY